MKKHLDRQNKTLLVAAIVLFLTVLLFVSLYHVFTPQPSEGTKSITMEIVDEQQATTTYAFHTNAEYLLDAMKDAPNLSFSGREDSYGLTLITLNGTAADWNKDNAFWCIYVNGEIGNYGIETQPVTDGDLFRFVYTNLNA